MTDLTAVLPDFQTHQFVRLLPSLEKNKITTADLLTLDCVEIAKRAQLPILDLKRLSKAVLEALQGSLGVATENGLTPDASVLRKTGNDVLNAWNTISTLDDDLDRVLGGGIPTGYITEVTGESGAGKTQFLLTLLLAAQLPAPYGLSTQVLYISTESPLPVTRLSQLLKSHPVLQAANPMPTLNSVHSIVTPDLESQDHILQFQVPVAIRQYGIRLIILDSVAANYRAEFERLGAGAGGQTNGANMGQRSAELVKLGQLLRKIAREHSIAIVVANQVADRFSGNGGTSPVLDRDTQSSPLARSGGRIPSNSMAMPMSSISGASELVLGVPISTPFAGTMDPMSLDHQQRWFTGWGDDPHPSHVAISSMKTPSLGLIWTTQIACRIAFIKRPVYGPGLVADEENERGEAVLRMWRRWMKVVFAPHAGPSGPGLEGTVEFEIRADGLRAVKGKAKDNDADDNEAFS